MTEIWGTPNLLLKCLRGKSQVSLSAHGTHSAYSRRTPAGATGLHVLVPPCCVHRDRRPDLNRKRRPFTPFCFPFLKVFYFVPVFVFCPPLTQCTPDRNLLNARRIAADSMPAGSPLTQARWIAADSCPPAAANPSPTDP